MYHTPEWYTHLRDVGMLWQALAGVMIFWKLLPRRPHSRAVCVLFWLIGGILLFLSRRTGLLLLEKGSNVYIVYILCISMVVACRRVSAGTAWMVGGTGFLAQHICGNLELALRAIPEVGNVMDYTSWIILLDIICYSVMFGILRRLFRDNNFEETDETSELTKVMYSLLAGMFSLGFYTINQYIRGWEQLDWTEIFTNSLYAAIGGIFLLIMQYGIFKRAKIIAENQAFRTMLYAQSVQWKDSLEHTELVNEKYHDLKKILGTFRGKINASHLDALNEAISAYEDRVDTGNQVADVVLTECRERCRKYGIQFTSFVNGANLAFMEDLDLYSLLKNALDNAVEALQGLPENRERFLSLTVHREGELVLLHMENPCGEVAFKDGMPQTGSDTDYHGFGMKSMARIVGKFGGALTCDVRDHVFYLDIVLPVPGGQQPNTL